MQDEPIKGFRSVHGSNPALLLLFLSHSTQGRVLPHATRWAYRHAAALPVLPGHRAAGRRLDLLHLEGRSHREYRFPEQTALHTSNTAPCSGPQILQNISRTVKVVNCEPEVSCDFMVAHYTGFQLK